MSIFTALQQGIETVSQKLGELDDQHSQSDEYMLGLINEVGGRVRQNQAQMMQNRTEHERITREYEQAIHLRHSLLELLRLKANSGSYPTGIIRDLDANVKALAPSSAANGEVAGPGAVPYEHYAAVDPDHLPIGLQRMLKKKANV